MLFQAHLPVATLIRHTASLRASTAWRTPASHASIVSGPASRAASPSAVKRMRPSRTLSAIGPGAECSSSLSPAFIASNTTFRPPPLRSVIELRRPSRRSFSSRKHAHAASTSRSKACSGPCRGLSDPGCGRPTKTQPPLSSHSALPQPAPERGRVHSLSRTEVIVTYPYRGLVPYYSAISLHAQGLL